MSAQVQQVIAKLRKNLKIDEGDLRKMLSEKVNQRLYISLIDKVGGTIKETVWSSHQHDGVGYLFAVLKVAVMNGSGLKVRQLSLNSLKYWRPSIDIWSKLF